MHTFNMTNIHFATHNNRRGMRDDGAEICIYFLYSIKYILTLFPC